MCSISRELHVIIVQSICFFPLCAVGFILCSGQLSVPGAADLWKLALQDGYALTLHRDECLLIHGLFENLLSQSKDKA